MIVFPNVNAATAAQTSVFINIPVDASGEGGLLGMAFHPNFPSTPQVFLSYTRTGPDAQHPLTSVISRFTSNDGGATLNPASEQQILTLDQPFTNHNGGNIAFDRFGKLFIGLGDGGSANDPQNNGQNVNTLLGKMLRIDVDSAPAPNKNYAIPSDNPFAAGGGAPEIYAWGLRNPWRWSFDRDTGAGFICRLRQFRLCRPDRRIRPLQRLLDHRRLRLSRRERPRFVRRFSIGGILFRDNLDIAREVWRRAPRGSRHR